MPFSSFPRAVLVLLALVACSGNAPAVPENVVRAYDAYVDAPTPATYVGFVQANRLAAHAHDFTDDERGVTHQLLALEVMTREALRTTDLRLAQSVVDRVDEIETSGAMAVYDEVVPGARERLIDARERAGAVGR